MASVPTGHVPTGPTLSVHSSSNSRRWSTSQSALARAFVRIPTTGRRDSLSAVRFLTNRESHRTSSIELAKTFLDPEGFRQEFARKGRRAPVLKRPHAEARLFGQALFELSKLRVLVLPAMEEDDGSSRRSDPHSEKEPRIYTLTHSDFTAQLMLTVARKINAAQLAGWYKRLQRDEVLAEWRKTQGAMSLHVHCHISGGDNFLHALIARLRFQIFQKELPVVLAAFMAGDGELFRTHPDLSFAPVWVYFHSTVREFAGVECWGPLAQATRPRRLTHDHAYPELPAEMCAAPCDCCSRHPEVVPVPESLKRLKFAQQQREA